MGRLVLVQPGPGAPDLLPLEAWKALSAEHVFLAPGDELGMRLADVEIPFAVLEEAAPERLKPPPRPAGKGPELKLVIAAHKHGETTPGATELAQKLTALSDE